MSELMNNKINDDELENVTGGETRYTKNMRPITCPICNGSGKFNGVICSECKGRGVIEK